ncbi:class I adenylate-forming enzyme family protein [Actinomycetospora termitidis]|uniref:Class I adenylate-forming enzyme family protein n=1 Tax=Actinomycetospora termitidis TaxID=3053470 RepID=A0ABT7M5S7_9PSEU|nr:class I adenylate-forming enzyme family protein [Actinomycetospora sp. Odt1-22]MDL5155609.1 class I adenylate-forming enzyme family protein [Actinomycetospora sp. Odt1-22]
MTHARPPVVDTAAPHATLVAALDAAPAHDEAVVGGEGRLTYGELRDRTAQLAADLLRRGLHRGDRVAVLLPNGVRWIVAALAAHRAGLTVVPLNTWYRAAELEHVIEEAAVSLVVTDHAVFGRDTVAELRGAGFPVPGQDVLVWAAEDPLPDGLPGDGPTADLSGPEPGDLAWILFTSGSTARPKPVPLEHGTLMANTREIARRQHLRRGDRLWLGAPLFFGYGCSNALPVALGVGATLCLEPRIDGEESLAFIARERCTVYYGFGAATRVLLAAPSFGEHDLSSLRTGTTGFSAEEKRLVIDELGVAEVCSVYGLSEAYGHSAMSDAHDPREVRLQTSGTALPTQELRVCDEAGTPLAAGATGEIEVRGAVIGGYLDRPDLDDGVFRPGGWMRTGDLGVLDDDGRLAVVGRRKEMLKVKGINIAPLEVEDLLVGHPDVSEAYVVGLPDAAGDEVMVAAVIASRDVPDLPDALVAWIRGRAASYKVPSRIVLLATGDVPLTSTGKVSKKLLREQLGGA